EVELLSPVERDRLLQQWSGAVVPVADVTLPELFQAQVQRSPDAVAVCCDGEELTYAQLNARANRLAWLLRQRGVGAGSVVGLLLPRSVEMVVAVLGVLKAGGAYLPVDPEYPVDRVEFMFADARPVCVVAGGGLA